MNTFKKITALLFIIFLQTALFAQSGVNEHAIKFDPVNTQNAFLVGENGVIMKSTDNGLTWNQKTSGVTNILYGVTIVDGNTSFAVGENGIILKTNDGGNTWNLINTGATETLRDIEVSTAGYIMACGDNGIVITSNDLFARWNVTHITSSNLNQILALPNNELVVVGDNSTCLKSYDGYLWQQVMVTNEPTNFKGVAGMDELHLWILTAGRKMYFPVNQVEWSAQNAPSGTLNAIHFFNLNDGIIVGDNGLILKSTDGGLTWNQPKIQNPTTNNLLDISFSSLNDGITVGDLGANLYSTDGGSTWQGQAPSHFKTPIFSAALFQNYPNPFNPSTNISYILPFSSSVTLKIYDMLGREVKTLVNEMQSPGNHNYTFDASNLSSGIYYYVLKASNGTNQISKTMKMILTK